MPLSGAQAQDRWRQLATPAAGIWISAGLVALRAGHPAAWRRAADISTEGWFGAVTVVVAVGGAGLAAAALAELIAIGIRRLWLGYAVPRPLSVLLVRWRRGRWRGADDRAHDKTATAVARRHAERRRTRIALAEPESPTWMGDRVAAAEHRVRNECGLDLPSAWSRLWLLVPEPTRVDLREARAGFESASRWMAWSVVYAATAVAWWPLAGLAVVTAALSLQLGRAAVASASDLAEAAVDLHGVALARALGVTVAHDWLEVVEGQRVNRRTRKGA